MSDKLDVMFSGLLGAFDELEDAAEGVGDAVDRLIRGRQPAQEEGWESPEREELISIVKSLPESEREVLIDGFLHLLTAEEQAGLAERIWAELPDGEKQRLKDEIRASADQQDKVKRVRAWVKEVLPWLLFALLEVFVQTPVQPLASDLWDKVREAARESVGERQHPLVPELVTIPAGRFWMGTDRRRLERAELKWKDWMEHELPYHQAHLPRYQIGKYPVTNSQYETFVKATDHRAPGHWEGGKVPTDKKDHPVVRVSWHSAMAYCRWLSKRTGRRVLLPSEAEWEKAARGADGRVYPWGDDLPTAELCNSGNSVGNTTPVGMYSPWGDSPHGCADMAGNAWEWTRSLWGTDWGKPGFGYPYDSKDGRENLGVAGDRVLRGGAFGLTADFVRCAYRGRYDPDLRYRLIGFRVVVAPFSPPSDL